MWWDVLVTVCTAVGALYLIGIVPIFLLVYTADKETVKILGLNYPLSCALGWPGFLLPLKDIKG